MIFQKTLMILITLSLFIFGCSSNDAVDVVTTHEADSKSKAVKPVERNAEGSTTPDFNPGFIENHLPQIKSATFADPYIHHGVDIFVLPEAFDEDGDDVVFTYRWFLNGQELTGENEPVLRGNRFVKGDKIALWIVPSDEYGSGKTFYGSEFVIPNAPPEFDSDPAIAFAGASLNFVVHASDPDSDNFLFYLETAPSGMIIGENSGEVSWERQKQQQGPFHFKVVVQDSDGAKNTLSIKIED